MTFTPHFQTTLIGSFPHTDKDAATLCRHIASSVDVPVWPQLPRRTFRENMYVQYSTFLPGIIIDEANEKITFNTADDLTPAMEAFYSHYLADEVDAFAVAPEYAAGFYAMLDVLRSNPGEWVKGQVTGPITLGLKITDQDLRSSLYDEMLAEAIVKGVAMTARWQVQQLKAVRPNVIMFVDEPYMASFGSAFISLSREQVVEMLDEVFDAIHQEGGLAGVHCCANTDWSVLLATGVDILNLDAYGYLDNLALYPEELRAFLDRGGVVAWGVVPNDEDIFQVTPEQLVEKLRDGLTSISGKAQARGISIGVEELASRSLITPACGLGPTTVEVAEKTLETLGKTAGLLQ
ncbi:MAG: methionine synthase [Anaerolineae bacterium]|nr:methionine synthase [Anaerolineae bacterium]